jgi:hypothetical protein
MTYLSDDDLSTFASDLEAHLHDTTGWHEPPRLYGCVPDARSLHHPCRALGRAGRAPRRLDVPIGDGHAWVLLAEGDPYQFLDEVRVDERHVVAVALATCGWSLPPELYGTWLGRPSEHPARLRVRSVVVVTPDLRHRSALRLRRPGESPIVTADGEGPMMRALLSVWWEGGRAA